MLVTISLFFFSYITTLFAVEHIDSFGIIEQNKKIGQQQDFLTKCSIVQKISQSVDQQIMEIDKKNIISKSDGQQNLYTYLTHIQHFFKSTSVHRKCEQSKCPLYFASLKNFFGGFEGKSAVYQDLHELVLNLCTTNSGSSSNNTSVIEYIVPVFFSTSLVQNAIASGPKDSTVKSKKIIKKPNLSDAKKVVKKTTKDLKVVTSGDTQKTPICEDCQKGNSEPNPSGPTSTQALEYDLCLSAPSDKEFKEQNPKKQDTHSLLELLLPNETNNSNDVTTGPLLNDELGLCTYQSFKLQPQSATDYPQTICASKDIELNLSKEKTVHFKKNIAETQKRLPCTGIVWHTHIYNSLKKISECLKLDSMEIFEVFNHESHFNPIVSNLQRNGGIAQLTSIAIAQINLRSITPDNKISANPSALYPHEYLPQNMEQKCIDLISKVKPINVNIKKSKNGDINYIVNTCEKVKLPEGVFRNMLYGAMLYKQYKSSIEEVISENSFKITQKDNERAKIIREVTQHSYNGGESVIGIFSKYLKNYSKKNNLDISKFHARDNGFKRAIINDYPEDNKELVAKYVDAIKDDYAIVESNLYSKGKNISCHAAE